jgi:hypothetical protein
MLSMRGKQSLPTQILKIFSKLKPTILQTPKPVALNFQWDKSSLRYRYKDTGKFVSKQAVENLTEQAISQVGTDISTIGQLLVDKKITIQTWYDQTREAIKLAHTWSYMLGGGGQANLDQSDYGRIGAEVKRQDGFLRQFAEDLRNNTVSEAQFNNRLNLYVNAADNTYEIARNASHSKAGYLWERRKRTKSDSCPSCIFYENLGWRTINSLPNPGQKCECHSNCGCYKEFSKNLTIPADSAHWGNLINSKLFNTFQSKK